MINKLHSFHFLQFSRMYMAGPELAPSGSENGLNFEGQVTEWLANPDLNMDELAQDLEAFSLKDLQHLSKVLDEHIAAVQSENNSTQEQDLNQLRSLKKSAVLLSLEEWVKSSDPSVSTVERFVDNMKDLSPADLKEISDYAGTLKRKLPYETYNLPQNEAAGISRDRTRILDLQGSMRVLEFKKAVEADPTKANDLLANYLQKEEVDYNEGAPQNYWEMLPEYVAVMSAQGIPLEKQKLEPIVKAGLASMLADSWEGSTECAISRFKMAESTGLVAEADFKKMLETDLKKRINSLVPRLKKDINWETDGDNDVAAINLSKDFSRIKDLGMDLDKTALGHEMARGVISYIETTTLPKSTVKGKVERFLAPFKDYTFSDSELNLSGIESALAKMTH